MTAAHERYRAFLEDLTPKSLPTLKDYVRDDVHFRDPFNDVRGADAMARVFRDMFDQLGEVRFAVHDVATAGSLAVMVWRFESRLRGRPWAFDGCSVIRFDDDGRVVSHVDHWDAAGAFYARLPVIGWLIRLVRRRLAVD